MSTFTYDTLIVNIYNVCICTFTNNIVSTNSFRLRLYILAAECSPGLWVAQ